MDRGQKETGAILKNLEQRINKEYKLAIDDIESQLSDYLRRFEIKDKKWQEWVETGYKTEEQYKQWRMQQMAVGQKWSEQKDQIAYELAHVNETAKTLAKMAAPEIFAENANYSTYKIEKDAKVDTNFTLYSRESVAELIANDPEVLPPVGKKTAKDIAMGKAVKWNRQQLQSVMIQGILQGDSIPKLATRLASTVGDKDRKAAIRNARTMATAAQNAGRVESYKTAESKGIELEQMWIATLDNRTRHSHRWLDGEKKPVGEPFSNGCRYPADPEGAPAEVYNCRCTLRGVVKGLDRQSGKFRDNSAIEGMTYDEWRNAKSEPQDILMQENKGKAIKGAYIREYAGFNTDAMFFGKNSKGTKANIKENQSEKIINTISNVLETDPSKIAIKGLPKEAQNNVLEAVKTCVDKCPQLKGYLNTIRLREGMKAIASSDSYRGIINLSGRYKDMKQLRKDYAEDVKVLYFPKGTTAESAIYHEIGHQIDVIMTRQELYGATYGSNGIIRTSEKVRHDVLERLGYFGYAQEQRRNWISQGYTGGELSELLKGDEKRFIRDHLSEYASVDGKEFFAECFSEYMTSKHPREAAMIFGEIFEKLLGELK